MAIKPEEIPPLDYNRCPLHGYAIECSGDPELHHIISRGKASKSPAQPSLDLRYNLIWVCKAHNFGRWADTPIAMQALYLLQAIRYGRDEVADYLDELPWKVARPEYSSRFLLS